MSELENKIIASAKELFIKNGYEDTSMSDIAALVGMNRSGIHYYYRTKEKMFQAVAGSIINEILPTVNNILDNDKMSFFEKVEHIADQYISVYKRNPDLVYFIFNELRRDSDPLINLAKSEGIFDYLDRLISLLQSEMDAGRIRKIPLQYIGCQIVSQLFFPFIAKSVITKMLLDSEESFDTFVDNWKGYVLAEIRQMLEIKQVRQ